MNDAETETERRGWQRMPLLNRILQRLVVAVSDWSRDHNLVRVYRNSGILLSGNVISGLIGLVSLALTARALGTEAFGVLVLIATYVAVVDTLVNFQSWQAVTRFGASALERRRIDEFRSLVKFGFLLDLGTAVAAAFLALAGIWLMAEFRGWDSQLMLMCAMYSSSLLIHIAGTPTAVLRLFDRFDLLVYNQLFAATAKCVGAGAAYVTGGGLWFFVIVWVGSDVLGHIGRLVLAQIVLRDNRIQPFMKASVRSVTTTFEGLWRFVWTTNMHSSVKLALKELDLLLIGVWLGPSAAGTYKIVKALGARIGKLATPLQQAIYPDLSRLAAVHDYSALTRLTLRPTLTLSVVGLAMLGLFAALGRPALELIFGEAFIGAYVPTTIYLVGVLIAMVTFPFHPTLLALGRAGTSLIVLILASAVYLGSLYYGGTRFGLSGAAGAYVVFYLTWAAMMTVVLFPLLRSAPASARLSH